MKCKREWETGDLAGEYA